MVIKGGFISWLAAGIFTAIICVELDTSKIASIIFGVLLTIEIINLSTRNRNIACDDPFHCSIQTDLICGLMIGSSLLYFGHVELSILAFTTTVLDITNR